MDEIKETRRGGRRRGSEIEDEEGIMGRENG